MTSPWRKQQAVATRRQIALAARRRFSADGYAAATIEAIAAEAGVAPATVYKIFGTKRAMAGELLALVNQCQERLTGQLCQLLLSPGQRHQSPNTAARSPSRAGRQHRAEGAGGAGRPAALPA